MERKIGEIFQDGDVTLKVVKVEHKRCVNNRKKCYYSKFDYCHTIKCMSEERSDNTQVNFIKIK